MIKVTELSENDLREIGLAYANYIYPDDLNANIMKCATYDMKNKKIHFN